MKILVTGIAGYLGQVLYYLLKENGHEITGLDNFLYKQDVSDFNIIQGDITSYIDMYNATKGVDAVVALAAIVGDEACGLDSKATESINYGSTRILIDVCKQNKVKKIIYASTCSVYGTLGSVRRRRLLEGNFVNPLTLYAKTKYQSEKLLLNAIRKDKLDIVILRFGTLYGYAPRMRFDLVVNIMAATAFCEDKIHVFGGNQWRPLVHVKDAAKTILTAIGKKNTYNIYNVA